MPRNYIRKSERATGYSQEDLEIAVEKVKSKELTNYAAAKMFNIPSSTLNDRVLGKKRLKSETMGRPLAIPMKQEIRLANCLRTLEKWGFGLSREEVMEIVSEFIKKNNLKTPFKNNTPGADWFISFRKRHRLSIKKPQPVEYLRKKMTDPFIIQEYFTLLENTLKELNITDPKEIWNLDETSVCLDPTKTKVVGGKGLPCSRTTHGTGKDNVTVLATVNANGDELNPLIVFKAKAMYEKWMATHKKEHKFEIAYAVTKRGWMETETFYNYMKDVVIPGLGEKRPILMIYDGHCTHVDDKVVELALQNNVTILKLPPHTSHLLQPLDLAVFRSFKAIWDAKLVKWQRKNVGAKLQKLQFSEMFANVWHETKPEVIKNGFKKAGIFPFNADVVPIHKYNPATYKRWLHHIKTKNQILITLKQLCLNAINEKLVYSTSTHEIISAPIEDNSATPAILLFLESDVPTFEASSQQIVAPNVSPVSFPVSGATTSATGLIPRSEYISGSQGKHTLDDDNTFAISTDKSIINDSCNIASGIRLSFASEIQPDPKIKIMSCNSIENPECKARYITDFEELFLNKMQQQCRNDGKSNSGKKNVMKMIRITKGAEVITRSFLEKKRSLEVALDKKIEKKKTGDSKKKGNSKKTNQNATKNSNTKKNSPAITRINDVLAIPGCSKERTNTKRKSKKLCSVKMNKRRSPDTSDTEVSGTLSKHSDSDIIDIEDNKCFSEDEHIEENTNFNSCPIIDECSYNSDYINTRIKSQQKNSKKNILKEIDIENSLLNSDSEDILHNENINDIILDESTGELIPSKKWTQTNKNKIGFDLQSRNKETYYHVNDSVLVRYYKRKWIYYIGFVESTRKSDKKMLYTIKFLKTQNKPKLKFIMPKKKDQDEVADCSIVKSISLARDPENINNYVLRNKDDELIYFS